MNTIPVNEGSSLSGEEASSCSSSSSIDMPVGLPDELLELQQEFSRLQESALAAENVHREELSLLHRQIAEIGQKNSHLTNTLREKDDEIRYLQLQLEAAICASSTPSLETPDDETIKRISGNLSLLKDTIKMLDNFADLVETSICL